MIYIYRYRLKNKKFREKVNLTIVEYEQSIQKAVTTVFSENLISISVRENFFEFRLYSKAKKQQLQNVGKEIIKNNPEFNQYKSIYRNSSQLTERIKNRLYGFLESVHINEKDEYVLVFDSVYAVDVDFIFNENAQGEESDNNNFKAERLKRIYSFTAEVHLTREEAEKVLEIIPKEQDLETNDYMLYSWYMYEECSNGTANSISPFSAEFYNTMVDEDQLTIGGIKRLLPDDYLSRRLANYFSLDSLVIEDLGEAVLKNALSLTIEDTPAFVAVYNVGQASCSAICDSEARPLVYFDFGAAYGRDSRSYPKGQNYCFRKKPVIILSHWDKDHWYGGIVTTQAQECKWIVPNQQVGPQATQFAYLLWEKGNLYIWDDRVPSMQMGYGTVFKCNGNDDHRHNYGIGILARIIDANCEEKKYLLPGDNRYKFITRVISHEINKLDGLVASHHGGKYYERYEESDPGKVAAIPYNTNKGKIIYSAGDPNSHSHPSHNYDYIARGWVDVLETKSGHCALGLLGVTTSMCAGRACDLKIINI